MRMTGGLEAVRVRGHGFCSNGAAFDVDSVAEQEQLAALFGVKIISGELYTCASVLKLQLRQMLIDVSQIGPPMITGAGLVQSRGRHSSSATRDRASRSSASSICHRQNNSNRSASRSEFLHLPVVFVSAVIE